MCYSDMRTTSRRKGRKKNQKGDQRKAKLARNRDRTRGGIEELVRRKKT